ncbi:MAG TPA: hypothetical protein DD716_04410 [Thiomicrospira sp.]|nr:hypothetical protein [Thiomicrospira sp.]
MTDLTMSKSLRYFFKRLEKRSDQLDDLRAADEGGSKEVPFDEIERFSRAIMTQNIFIHTVGINGKHESTILAKAMFSINKVVRLYYSTSIDESRQGYLRLRADQHQQLILVERLHGLRPKPELLYASLDECHVIRFFVNWILKRIDWQKTKIKNLDLYRNMKEIERLEYEEQIAKELELLETQEIQSTLERHFGKSHRLVRKS